jgi:uncharacterized membrane protein
MHVSAAAIAIGSVVATWGAAAQGGVAYQPDAHIKVPGVDLDFSGDDLYDTDYLDDTIPQQLRQVLVATGETAKYKIRLENDGSATDRFKVTAIGGDEDWKVRYYRKSKNITQKVTEAGYRPLLESGERRTIRLEVTADPGQGGYDIVVFVRSLFDGAPGLDDHVRAETNLD